MNFKSMCESLRDLKEVQDELFTYAANKSPQDVELNSIALAIMYATDRLIMKLSNECEPELRDLVPTIDL